MPSDRKPITFSPMMRKVIEAVAEHECDSFLASDLCVMRAEKRVPSASYCGYLQTLVRRKKLFVVPADDACPPTVTVDEPRYRGTTWLPGERPDPIRPERKKRRPVKRASPDAGKFYYVRTKWFFETTLGAFMLSEMSADRHKDVTSEYEIAERLTCRVDHARRAYANAKAYEEKHGYAYYLQKVRAEEPLRAEARRMSDERYFERLRAIRAIEKVVNDERMRELRKLTERAKLTEEISRTRTTGREGACTPPSP